MTDASCLWIDDQNALPNNFLGLPRPDGGFFLVSSDQSKSSLFNDQEDVQRLGGVVYRYELDQVLAQAKALMKTRKFKDLTMNEDVAHGVMFWHLDEEKSLVLLASSDRNTDLTDAATPWVGETRQPYDTRIDGVGPLSSVPEEAADLLKKPAKSALKV